MVRKQTGKGGDFDTRPNPFTSATQRSRSSANFTEVPNIGKALQLLVESGCAIIIGQTRDGGAMVLTILDQDDRHRTYCSNDVELQAAVDAVIDMYEKM